MRRGRIFIFLAIIIILMLIGGFLIYQFVLNPSTTQPDAPATGPDGEVVEVVATPETSLVPIYVVTQFIPRGTVVNETHFETHIGTIDYPEESIYPGMFRADVIDEDTGEPSEVLSMAAIIDRQVKTDVDAGMPLVSTMLVDKGQPLSATWSLAALQIEQGKVAISIPIDRLSGISYALRPGDRVSVIGSMMILDVDTEFQTALPNSNAGIIGPGKREEDGPTYLAVEIDPAEEGAFMPYMGRTELDPLLNELVHVMPAEPQRARLVTQMLLQDAVVLHVGEFSYEDLAPQEEEDVPAEGEVADGTEAVDQGTPQEPVEETVVEPPDVVTLVVSPQDAVTLQYMLYSEMRFMLALRANADTSTLDTEAVTLQYMLEVYNIPIPAKLPYALEPRYDLPVGLELPPRFTVPISTR